MATVVALQEPGLVESFASPDGRWQAEIYAYDCIEVAERESYAFQELRLAGPGMEPAQVVDSQLMVCGGLGAAGLGTRFWSSSSRYL